MNTLRSRWPEISPAMLLASLQQGWRRVDRKCLARNLKHGQIVNRVAEDGVRLLKPHAPKRVCFALVGRHVYQIGSHKPIDDAHLSRQYALFGNAELPHAFADDPLVS